MKIQSGKAKISGLTLMEVLSVIAVIVVLAGDVASDTDW